MELRRVTIVDRNTGKQEEGVFLHWGLVWENVYDTVVTVTRAFVQRKSGAVTCVHPQNICFDPPIVLKEQ